MEIILLKLGELVLKGLNRNQFESRLLRNISYRLSPIGKFRVYAMQSTVYVEPESESDSIDDAFSALQRVFGATSICRAYPCEKDLDAILEAAKTRLSGELLSARTFKVEARRADKRFPFKSPEIASRIGEGLLSAFPHLKVDVHTPELTVYAEVRDLAAYVHSNPIPGAGGLPVGTGGRAAVLLSGGIDSPVAAYRIARRGVELEAVHFFSYPYTSERAKHKVETLAGILSRYTGALNVHMVPFTRIQEEIRAGAPEDLFTLLMRRAMMKISESIALENNLLALVTGESLGQVASQTLQALAVTGEGLSLPVLRPLVGLDKEEIVKTARDIGTFETSILPYEDCCTVFTPKHPKTKPRLRDIQTAEQSLHLEPFMTDALKNTERQVFSL